MSSANISTNKAKNDEISKETILTAICQGAGNPIDGTTKNQVVDWIVKNIGHKKTAALKVKVEKLLKDAKQKAVLVRGKNNSRYKLALPDAEEYNTLKNIKIERIKPKAISAPTKTKKKSTQKSPPTQTQAKPSTIFTCDPFMCHDPSHPEYDPESCEPPIDPSFSLCICTKLVDRAGAIDESHLKTNEKRFNAYAYAVLELKNEPKYSKRYTERKHKLPPVIVQKIAAMYPYCVVIKK